MRRGDWPAPERLGSSFEALLDAAPDGIAVVDAEGTMRVTNEALEQLAGYGRH